MNARQFYDFLANEHGEEPIAITLSPGPIRLRSARSDVYAGKLLLWLAEIMPEDSTNGDLFDVLASAHFWHTFWSALDHDGEESS